MCICLTFFGIIIDRFCTSIIAQDSKGNLYHGRNLDYPFEILKNATVDVSFMKDGKVIFASVVLLFLSFLCCSTFIEELESTNIGHVLFRLFWKFCQHHFFIWGVQVQNVDESVMFVQRRAFLHFQNSFQKCVIICVFAGAVQRNHVCWLRGLVDRTEFQGIYCVWRPAL